MKIKLLLILLLSNAVFLTGCYTTRKSRGGGQIKTIPARITNTSDILLMPGYKIELVSSDLTFPAAVTFDEAGEIYVIETGYSYGELWTEPKLIKLNKDGSKTTVATGGKNGPWTGVVFHKGYFYVAEGGALEGGKILRISKTGTIKVLTENLPSMGDHQTNCPVIKDDYIYFGQGTATNSGVVGPDNADFGWLLRKKDFHDIPCKDIILNGINYPSDNILTDEADDTVLTGPYSEFGKAVVAGEVIKGAVPCTGSIMRIPLEGGKPELVAWGLRNPYGLAFSADGKLFLTENGFDDRGSRPVWGAGDVLWEIQTGMWYGWPDFSEGKPIQNDEEFKVPGKTKVKAVLQKYPNDPPKPIAVFGVHSSSNGIDFSTSSKFGFEGEAFVAQFGDMAPTVGDVLTPVGFKIVRVDVKTGVIRDFAVNAGRKNGPASWLGKGGLERPLSVKFDPTGEVLYITDFGIMKMTKEGPMPQVKTGVIWKITKL